MPAVQTGVARYAADKLKSLFNAELEIGSIQIHPFNAVTIRDAVLIDPHPYTEDINGTGFAPVDTIARIGKLSANISIRRLFLKKVIAMRRVEAEDLLFQLTIEPGANNLTRVLNLKSSGEESQMTLDSIFTIGKVNIKDARFRMLNYCSVSTREHGINFGDMDVRCDVKGHNIGFYGGRMHAVVDKLVAEEKSGFKAEELSGHCHVGLGKTTLKKIHLKDGCGSDLYLPDAELSYADTKAWSDFIHQVSMDIRFAPSRLVLESISYFSGGTFKDNKFIADIASGRFRGTVSDFRTENFSITTPYGPYGKVNVHMYGLPSIMDTGMDAEIEELKFTVSGLEAALKALGSKANVGRFAPGEQFDLHAKASGPMNRLSASADISSSIGAMVAKATLRNMVDRNRPMQLNANVVAREFDLGKLLTNDALGPSSFSATASGTLGSRTALTLEGLEVSKLEVLGYEYSDIHLAGSFIDKTIVASLQSEDPNAQITLDGNFNLRKQHGSLYAELDNIDLAALNIDKRGGASNVSCTISADQGIQKNAPIHVQIGDLLLTCDQGPQYIGDIEAEARLDGDHLTAILSSAFMDAKYNGPSNLGGLVKYVKSVSLERDMPAFFAAGGKAPELTGEGMDATLSAIFLDTKGLLAFAMPGMAIAEGTAVNLDVDRNGTLLGYINSPSLDFKTIHTTNLSLSVSNQFHGLNCTVNTDQLKLKSLTFDNAGINLDADENLASLGIMYAGANLLENGSELNLQALILRDEKGRPSLDVSTLQSYLSIKNDVWNLSKSDIGLHGGEISVEGFRLASERQSIEIDGALSPFGKDTMQVKMHNLDLALVNEFMSESFPDIAGIIDGNATLISPVPSEMGLGGKLDLKDLVIAGRKAGDFKLNSTWDDTNKRIHATLDNYLGGSDVLALNASYGARDKSVTATALMDGFNPGPGAAFLKNYLTELDGRMYGKIQASGPIDQLNISSDGLRFEDMRTRISYTNVAYTLNGPLSLDDTGLKFNKIDVADDYGGKGTLTGGLSFRNFKDFRMDASLLMRRLKAIDIPDENSPIMVYGDLSLSGRGKITGPFNALYVDADVATSGDGIVNVPIPSSSTAHGSDLLTFVEPVTDEEAVAAAAAANKKPKSSSSFTTHAKVSLSPDVMAQVEIDKENGHVLTAGGTGEIMVDLNTGKGKLQLKGDYNIAKGKYLFNIPGVVSKEFDIQSGSSIQFNGNVMESTLDIHAIHNVKTSLATIVADTTSVSSRRTVECGINISGQLSNPDVSFSINVPDLDPNTKMQVEGALSTQDKVQKQFVALLLFGTFLPEEGSGVVNGTNMIASNVGEIVSSQLNNILQKLDIPLDFGLGYQQDNAGTDIFDVAVSTQLFNNRVLVNGSVGNRKYSTSKSAGGDVVGDLDIEIKMDKSGELRFKLFSHSADEFSSSLDFSQRNGLGLSYQKEFDRTIDFFRQMFMSRQRKQEDNMREMMRKREMTTITIE
ncbi:MAG: translocation/assembly module TamB domain-containing protein [Bacteroidales bacterium]|nr:translocation/assembly module TamB domain-containing protein [Bacteroidales bacterium]